MHTRHLYSVLLALLLLAGCQKAELPSNDFGTPVFALQTSVGEFTAGENDYYLFTDVTPGDTVSRLRGAFARTACPAANCPGSLIVEIGYLKNAQPVDTLLKPGFFPYIGQFQPANGFLANFEAKPTSPNATYLWDFGDGNEGDGPTIEHVYTDNMPRIVALTAEFAGGFRSRYTELIRFDTQPPCPGVSLRIEPDSFGAEFTAITSIPGNYTYTWSNGDSGQTIFLSDTATAIAVTVTDMNQNCSTTAQAENLPNLNAVVQSPYFQYTVDPIVSPSSFPAVSITWIDSEGIRWSTEGQQQPLDSFFEINSIEPYRANINGLPTRKIEAAFQCVLYNDSGEFMLFSGSGVLAVGAP